MALAEWLKVIRKMIKTIFPDKAKKY